jgi:hypothetical protein
MLGVPRKLLPVYTAFLLDGVGVGLAIPLLPFFIMSIGTDTVIAYLHKFVYLITLKRDVLNGAHIRRSECSSAWLSYRGKLHGTNAGVYRHGRCFR